MTVRIGLVGARAEVALMVAGVAAGCGAEVVAVDDEGGVGLVDGGALGAAADPRPEEACDVVLVDVVGLQRNGGLAAERPTAGAARTDARWLVVHLAGETEAARAWARVREVDHVVELPTGRRWLAEQLTATARDRTVLAIVGAVGGVGTTTVALSCALARAGVACGVSGGEVGCSVGDAGAAPGGTLLVDADPWSTGLDLPLGIPDGEGARWADLPGGGGALVADSLRAGLPQVRGIVVLTGPPPEVNDPRVASVVRSGRDDFTTTVLDAGRGPLPSAVGPHDAVALVVPTTLAGVVGAHRLLPDLPTSKVLLAVRPTGWLPPSQVAEQVGVERLIVVPSIRGLAERIECGDALGGRVGRTLVRLGEQVWGALS